MPDLDYKYYWQMHSMNRLPQNYNFPMGSDNFSKGKILFTHGNYYFIRSINGTRKHSLFFNVSEAIFIAVVGLWRTYTKAPTGTHKWKLWKYATSINAYAFPELVAALFNRPLKSPFRGPSPAHVHYRYLKLVNPA